MAEKEYVCAYKYCLHHGEKVKASESVVINKKHYHWDCAGIKQEIQDCVNSYMECIGENLGYIPVIDVKRNVLLTPNDDAVVESEVTESVSAVKVTFADEEE